jgi:hypothetical protein
MSKREKARLTHRRAWQGVQQSCKQAQVRLQIASLTFQSSSIEGTTRLILVPLLANEHQIMSQGA